MSDEKVELNNESVEVSEATVVPEEPATTTQYTDDDLRAQIKPLSNNGFVRCFQKLYRKWLGAWYRFRDNHKKLADLIYMVFFFVVFSMGVTIWQFIVMAVIPQFLPKTGEVGWPMVAIPAAGGNSFTIFGDAEGWATFICFEIAVFTAQCINFPLQRNITYRSHGNPWWQAMWYFIGWVLVSVATNAIWGICNPFLIYWGVPSLVNGLLKTVLTGGVSMVVFFFVFMIIFPNNVAVAKKAKKKYDNLIADINVADPEKIKSAKAKWEAAQDRANKSTAEKELAIASAQASGRAMQYFALIEKKEKAESAEEKAKLTESIAKALEDAGKAIDNKKEKQAEYDKAFGVA
ncbi:MAG: cell envelope integrity protein TolA [Clostridiales bacterium]|nr:cell envelope integrity protein TolA [Clostridiales bacterium]